jgi:hypothetical protein
VPPGPYALEIELVGTGEPATLAHLEVESQGRVFEPPTEMDQRLEVDFGDHFRLLGYHLSRDGSTLSLTLHWQATDQPDTSYKVFVHLYDPATGAIVAQNDAVPRDWTYPTTWWDEGEVVSDEIELAIGDVPQGAYHLAVGMYHPESGERLAVVDATGEAATQGRLVLTPEIVK